jgi:hypothetical protein
MNKYFGTILIIGNKSNLINLSEALNKMGFNVFYESLPEEYKIPFLIIYEKTQPNNDKNCVHYSEIPLNDLANFFLENYPFCINAINETMLRSIFSPDYGDETELMEFASGLISNFFKTIDTDLISLHQMLKDEDFEKMRRIFHRIKSTFGTFGLDHSKNLFAIWQKQESFSYNDLILLNMHVSVAKHSLMKWINK